MTFSSCYSIYVKYCNTSITVEISCFYSKSQLLLNDPQFISFEFTILCYNIYNQNFKVHLMGLNGALRLHPPCHKKNNVIP